MRCKPGDLAVITRRLPEFPTSELLGVIRRVTVLTVNRCDRPAWEYEGPRLVIRGVFTGRLREVEVLDDAILTPIRWPGEFTVDESAAWLPPVPQTDSCPNETPTEAA